MYPSDTSKCYPDFFLQSDLRLLANGISSAKIGCHSKNVAKTDTQHIPVTRPILNSKLTTITNVDSSKSSKSHEKMQKLTCYESAGKQGKSKDFIESSPYLDNQNFNNRAGSCCFQGMYVLIY